MSLNVYTNYNSVYLDSMGDGGVHGKLYYFHLKLLKFKSEFENADFRDIMGNEFELLPYNDKSYAKMFPQSCYIAELRWTGDMVSGKFRFKRAIYNTTLKEFVIDDAEKYRLQQSKVR